MGKTPQLPDSILTLEHTYMYVVSDPDKSQQILDILKERKEDKPWELNWCQADLYYNTGKYRLAIHYFEQVNKEEYIRTNPQLQMDLLSTMMECYRMNNQLDETMQSAIRVVDIAKELKNSAEMGRAYMFMGKVMFRQANKKLADEYFSLAAKHLEESQQIEYLYHFNLTLANLMTEYEHYQQAYEYSSKAEVNLEQMQETIPDLPIDQIEYEKARLYALICNILFKGGKKEQAAGYYTKFTLSPYATDSNIQRYILPYLLKIKEYNKVILTSERLIEDLKQTTDTLGQDMSAILGYIIEGYEMSGEIQKALSYAKQKNALTEALIKKEQENMAIELATIYNVQEKESRIIEQENALKIRNILLAGLIIILTLSTITIFLVILNLKHTRAQNRAMFNQIKEMQGYKEKLEKNTLTEKDYRIGNTPEKELNDITNIEKLFILANQKIREEKLYLKPDLVRDDVIKLLSVRKNDFIQAINEHAGGSFTDYINNIRMEVALKMLEESTDLSIECIAEDTGFGSVRSFYRQFKQKYNMSPSAYKKLVNKNN